jgi:hypothetical protein
LVTVFLKEHQVQVYLYYKSGSGPVIIVCGNDPKELVIQPKSHWVLD